MKFEKRQKFSIRKFSVGVASVIIGQFFLGGTINVPVVQANEVVESGVIAQDKGVEELQPSKGDLPTNVTKQKEEKVELGNKENIPNSNEITKEEKAVTSEIDKTDASSKSESEVSNNETTDNTDNKTKETTNKEDGLESNLSKEQLNNAIVEGEVVTKESEKFLNNLNY